MKTQPLFSDLFVQELIRDFNLATITGIRKIYQDIASLCFEIDSKKILNAKEEEIKPRFINTFFGDILGFNYGNSKCWQLKFETKSSVDATKPDATLGYFYVNAENNLVKAVIEVKGASTTLDSIQKRAKKNTTLDQAFEYAPKMGGHCSWVIVSNITETRFYHAMDRSRCQTFFLKDLLNEAKLKELIYLFHKDRFIKEYDLSNTEKLYLKIKDVGEKSEDTLHILDSMYHSLFRFDALNFVKPNYIANLKPFNLLDEYVWHYSGGNLLTTNIEIYNFITELKLEDDALYFSDSLVNELEKFAVLEAEYKLNYIIKFLRFSLITEISAVKDVELIKNRNVRTIGFSELIHFNFKEGEEGFTLKLPFPKYVCDCVSCNYSLLNFSYLLKKLKTGLGESYKHKFEEAYGNYLVSANDSKTAFHIYKSLETEIKSKEGFGVLYFLVKLNLKHLYNLVRDYQYDDVEAILKSIESIDLDKVVYDELEFVIDREVLKYLLEIKEDKYIFEIQDKIDDLLDEIISLKELYDNNGIRHAGPNLPNLILNKYFELYIYVNRSFIIYDVFNRYKLLTSKTLKGLLLCSQTDLYRNSINFNYFILSESIIHLSTDQLQKQFKRISYIKADKQSIDHICTMFDNLLGSYLSEHSFWGPRDNELLKEYLGNYRFKEKFVNIFGNIILVLSKIDITDELIQKSSKKLCDVLKIEHELYWVQMEIIGDYLITKGNLYTPEYLIDLLKIGIQRFKQGNNKYEKFIGSVCSAINKNYPDYKISDIGLISTAIRKCYFDFSDRAKFDLIIKLIDISNTECYNILFTAFNMNLNESFDPEFYEELLFESNSPFEQDDNFLKYTDYVINSRGGRASKFGKYGNTDLIFLHFISLIYYKNIDFKIINKTLMENSNDFEKWLLNPYEFDYSKFDCYWLLDLYYDYFFKILSNIPIISVKLNKKLEAEFHPDLAEIKYKYFIPLNNTKTTEITMNSLDK